MLAGRRRGTRHIRRHRRTEGELNEQITHSYTHCRFGVATRDVTPPVGIYARSWGAATHDVAEGVHRPFAATAAVFAPSTATSRRWRWSRSTSAGSSTCRTSATLRATILERTGLDDAALLINMSHTHAGANVNSQLTDKPGGELIEPYIEHLTEQIGAAILEARETLAPAWVTYGTGRCALATNRDLWDAEARALRRAATTPTRLPTTRCSSRGSPARTASCARRCSTTPATRRRSPGRTGCCRPTTSAPPARSWRAPSAPRRSSSRAPRASSPRATTTSATRPSPTATAASSATPPRRRSRACRRPATRFVYTGIVASGANLGAWEYQPCDAEQLRGERAAGGARDHVELRRKEDLGVVDEPLRATPDSVQEQEKALRRRFLSEALGDGPVYAMPVWTWRLGEALLVAIPNEPYSVLPGRAAAAPCRDASARARRDQQDDGLPLARGDLRHRALPGAAVDSPRSGEDDAPPVPHSGARRRSRLHDAALDLAARRGAARRRSERAVLGASRSSCGGASGRRHSSILGTTNRTMGYLSPEETYGTGLYQEQQSPFAPGCLEQTIEVAASALAELREVSSRRRCRRASSAAAGGRPARGACAPPPRRARGRGPGRQAATRSRPRARGAFGKSS